MHITSESVAISLQICFAHFRKNKIKISLLKPTSFRETTPFKTSIKKSPWLCLFPQKWSEFLPISVYILFSCWHDDVCREIKHQELTEMCSPCCILGHHPSSNLVFIPDFSFWCLVPSFKDFVDLLGFGFCICFLI